MRPRRDKTWEDPDVLEDSDDYKDNNYQDEEDLDYEYDEEFEPRKRAKSRDPFGGRILDGYKPGEDDLDDEKIRNLLAFCCWKCRCSTLKKSKIPQDDQYVRSSDNALWHRRCCHDAEVVDEWWQSSIEKASEDAWQGLTKGPKQDRKLEKVYDKGQVQKIANTAVLKETAVYNDDGLPGT